MATNKRPLGRKWKRAELRKMGEAPWMKEISRERLSEFVTWTFRPDHNEKKEVERQLNDELGGKSSVLELMKSYMEELKGSPDNNSPVYKKLAALFRMGRLPGKMGGQYFGVPLGLRTGDLDGSLGKIGNILGLLWGALLGDKSPWTGKSLTPMEKEELGGITLHPTGHPGDSFMGINHFNMLRTSPMSVISYNVVRLWMSLKQAPPKERRNFGHKRNGGRFIAFRAPSVHHASKREVVRLNYRWKALDNRPPLCWLIDEIVEVADGFYLGQLLFPSKKLFEEYDPAIPSQDWSYMNFGYFVIFDERWSPEARRLFPHLEVPVISPGLKKPPVEITPQKFSQFTFAKEDQAGLNDAIHQRILEDLGNRPTIMHLLRDYANELQSSNNNNAPGFLRMRELFARGIGIKTVKGFFRGALISWHSDGLLKPGNINTLNLAWNLLGRRLSNWTGKSFREIPPQLLTKITNGFEKGEVPTFWGANTLSARTPEEILIKRLMRGANIWTKQVPPNEAREFGYDMESFFLIGREAKSVNRNHPGKKVFQFNYRWPNLETIPPDCYCIDELVQIADGLYLGQLMYSTKLLKPYDPRLHFSEYAYGLFGYFLLMDESWHQIRLDIGFDLTNA